MTEQEFFQNIGKKLKKLRKDGGLTQQEIAEKAGIYRGDLATFENKGERIKSADIIRRIVEATGHTMADLFIDASEKKTSFTRSPIRKGNLCPS